MVNSICEMHVNGCPAIFDGGFDKLAFTVAGNKNAPIAPLKVSLKKEYIHEKYKEFGSLSGYARILDLEEVISVCSICVWYYLRFISNRISYHTLLLILIFSFRIVEKVLVSASCTTMTGCTIKIGGNK